MENQETLMKNQETVREKAMEVLGVKICENSENMNSLCKLCGKTEATLTMSNNHNQEIKPREPPPPIPPKLSTR